jgi:hypothetical protein
MRPSVLRIETGLLRGHPVTTLVVDDVHVLEVERQPGRSMAGRTIDLRGLGRDPADLLPPFSRALLPSTTPTPLMIAICGCGIADDYSVWVSLRRDAGEVVWEPTPVTENGHHSVRETWRFDLVAYLDAIDAATGPWVWDTWARVVAQELNDRRRWPEPQDLGPRGGHLRAAYEMQDRREPDAVILFSEDPDGGESSAVVPVEPHDTADDVLRRLADDPSLWRRRG